MAGPSISNTPTPLTALFHPRVVSLRARRIRTGVLEWCRYHPGPQHLEVGFAGGATRRYLGVPQLTVDRLICAASADAHFRNFIAGRFQNSPAPPNQPEPLKPLGTVRPLLERSMVAIAPHLPAELHLSVQNLLSQLPILVRVVRMRRTKHGDHRAGHSRAFSLITVNASGNPWQFAITLLHEIAHAQVSQGCKGHARPHGWQWKKAFGQLLQAHLDFFPHDVRGPLEDYAVDPPATTASCPVLAANLRRYDTTDFRPTVGDLAMGQRFSLNGRVVLTKGPKLRTWFSCQTADGRRYRVAPTVRVHTLDRSPLSDTLTTATSVAAGAQPAPVNASELAARKESSPTTTMRQLPPG